MAKKPMKRKRKSIKRGVLGAGAAQNAANKLKGRAARLAEQERIAMGGKPRKKGKDRR